MSSEYEPLNTLRVLELDKMKWTNKAKMLNPRLVSSGFCFSGGYAFAFGGAESSQCERYDPAKNKWEQIPSYQGVCSNKQLYNYTMCMVSK